MKRMSSGVLITLALSAGASFAQGATLYAKPAPTGSANCASWANACTLPTAVLAAQEGDSIWVKAGTHSPITLVDGRNVKIIGGFAGTETAASQSTPHLNLTTIDGGHTTRCVWSSGHTSATVLRGLRLINGFDGDLLGGGALSLSDSSPTVVDCLFQSNTAAYIAGAVLIYQNSFPKFINCTFRYNGSTTPGTPPYAGGAIFLYPNNCSLTAVNCLFHDNNAGEGGAIDMANGTLSATLINCTFAYNAATIRFGGALYDPHANATVRNCILWGNTTAMGAAFAHQIYNRGSYITSVAYSVVQGGWPGAGNLSADPMFVNSAVDNYHLATASPCRDNGDDAVLPNDTGDLNWNGNTAEVLPYDLDRLARVSNDTVDMGVYEFYVPPPAACCVFEQPCCEVLTEEACDLVGGNFKPQYPSCDGALCPCVE